MPTDESPKFPELLEAMKLAAAKLREAGIPCLLGGGLAGWARGGPPSEHDVDFFVREEDAERALAALVEAGLTPERPPEGWLFKAYHHGTLIDLIFRPSGGPIGDQHFARAEELEVAAQTVAVASLGDVMTTKLLSLSEQDLDYASVLEFARSLREQIDWDFVREQTADSPFARAFLTLTEELGVVEQAPSTSSGY
ncbi:MAG: nucleotidyltransferase family protein [Actinobacteria bacterium]|nr:nucleotidyltransferase family protein [Actinomycetota bacterium]